MKPPRTHHDRKPDPLYPIAGKHVWVPGHAGMDGLGWTPNVSLADGFARTYEWFLENVAGDAA